MTEKLQPVRGTHDLMPDDFRLHRYVAETARDVVGRGIERGWNEAAVRAR